MMRFPDVAAVVAATAEILDVIALDATTAMPGGSRFMLLL